MNKKKVNLQLVAIAATTEKRDFCYWCGTRLRECGTCYGKGIYKGNTCRSCHGTCQICSTHGFDWDD